MNKKIRNCLVFMIIISCFLTISSPVFAEAGMSEITDEEWKELCQSAGMYAKNLRKFYIRIEKYNSKLDV